MSSKGKNYFVIVEANKTHAGNAKEFILLNEQERYRAYWDKIIYIQVTDLPTSSPERVWQAENFQRNAIQRGLQGRAETDDRILVSDLDEIPNVKAIKANLVNPEWIVFKQAVYYYYVNCRVSRNWGGTTIVPYGSFASVQQVRNATRRHSFGVYPGGGWHYSYLTGDDPERIIYKAQNIADFYTGYHIGTPEEVRQKILSQVDLYGRNLWHTQMKIVDIGDDHPVNLPAFLAKYPQYLYRGAT